MLLHKEIVPLHDAPEVTVGDPIVLNWSKRVAAARARGYATEQDLMDARHWDTCAVGEAAAIVGIANMAHDGGYLGATSRGVPKDVADVACHFPGALSMGDFNFASRIVEVVEKWANSVGRAK